MAVCPAITLTSITESLKSGPGKLAENTENRKEHILSKKEISPDINHTNV